MQAMRFLPIVLASVVPFCNVLAQEAGATHTDWPHYGGTQFSWRYSALDQINPGNVKALTPAWMFQTGDYAENLQATPREAACFLIQRHQIVVLGSEEHLPVSHR